MFNHGMTTTLPITNHCSAKSWDWWHPMAHSVVIFGDLPMPLPNCKDEVLKPHHPATLMILLDAYSNQREQLFYETQLII